MCSLFLRKCSVSIWLLSAEKPVKKLSMRVEDAVTNGML
jgi:hypothetical protein